PQNRPMATALVLAVTADREARGPRKRGEELEIVPCCGLRHFPSVSPGIGGPLRGRGRGEAELHGRSTRRQVGKPHVVPVAARELGSRHAARGAAHGADERALALSSWRNQAI